MNSISNRDSFSALFRSVHAATGDPAQDDPTHPFISSQPPDSVESSCSSLSILATYGDDTPKFLSDFDESSEFDVPDSSLPLPSTIANHQSELADVPLRHADYLLHLLCHLGHVPVSSQFLLWEARPRQRLGSYDTIVMTDIASVGLSPDLGRLFCSPRVLEQAFDHLVMLKFVNLAPNGDFLVRNPVRGFIIDSASRYHKWFWILQALILSYRAVPWTLLETCPPDLPGQIVPHLGYSLEGMIMGEGISAIPQFMRLDLARSLLESAHYSLHQWSSYVRGRASDIFLRADDPDSFPLLRMCSEKLIPVAGNKIQATIEHMQAASVAQRQAESGTESGLDMTMISSRKSCGLGS